MVLSQEGDARKNEQKGARSGMQVAKRQHQPKPCLCGILKQSMNTRAASGSLSPPAGYTGGCPSAVERPTEPVFWQLRRVRVYAGTC